VIPNDVHHDRAFRGIRFPVGALSFDEAAIDVVQDDLEGGGDAMLYAGLHRLNLAAVLFAVVVKVDGKFVEHTAEFRVGPPRWATLLLKGRPLVTVIFANVILDRLFFILLFSFHGHLCGQVFIVGR
jgi:hypothetical protein